MKSKDISTEEKILEAAKEVFLKKGFDGARMQEIADTAGINKAMLHYYFRTKDRLFEHIFVTAISNIFPKVGGIFISDAPFEDKIRAFIRDYLSFILQNPFLPIFILHEMSANPERLIEHFTKFNFNEKVGYLHPDFIGYGEEHIEFTRRCAFFGFGMKNGGYIHITEGLTLLTLPSMADKSNVSKNREVGKRLNNIKTRINPFSDKERYEQIQLEMSTLTVI